MKYMLIILLISIFSHSCGNREINVLRQEIIYLNREIDSLNLLLTVTRHYFYDIHNTDDTLLYYIHGNETDLMQKGIIRRAGGLSRDYIPTHNYQNTHFISKSKHHIDTIVVYGKSPTVIGSFNPNHYVIVSDNSEAKHLFIITDKNRFWSRSRYLIIALK